MDFLKKWTVLISLASLLIACSSPTEVVFEEEPILDEETSSSEEARIVFAGDLANDGGCADHGSDDHCDLFEATLDLNSGAVMSVTQLTDTPESESYPVWNPNGEVVYYSIFKTAKTKDLGYVDLRSGEAGVFISGATWPEVSPDGNTLLYVENTSKKIMQAALGEDGLSVGEGTELTGVANQQDPDFSSDGRFVVFHSTDAGEGQGAVYDIESGETVSYGSRSGHCTFGALGFITLCDNVSGGGIFSNYYEDGALGGVQLFVEDQKPSVLANTDPALAVCGGTSFNYPTFCGDDEHLLVSTSCNEKGSVTFSRLFLIDLTQEEPVYYPLGLNLDEAFNGPGQSTWTVSCLAE